MNLKCSVFVAASVDGFIARPDGDIEWLHRPEYASDDNGGFGYNEFIADVDAVVMGRNTFEKVLTFPGWGYGQTPVVVLTSRPLNLPVHLRDKVQVENGAPDKITSRLAHQGKKHLYIDGGVTIQRFLRAKRIDEITITRIPILLGDGIPLFGALGVETALVHVETQTFGNGFVQSKYRVKYTR